MINKKKIAFLSPSIGAGGAERVICTLANEFHYRDYEVIIICLNPGEKPLYHLEKEVKVISLISTERKDSFFNRIRFGVVTFFSLIHTLKKESPSILFAFQTSANFWGGIVCSLLRIPYTVSERTSPKRTIYAKSGMMQIILSILYNKARAVIAPATGILESIKQNSHFKSLNNLQLIRNFVQPFNIFKEEKVHPNKFVLGAGRLEFVKGFDRLIDSFALLKTTGVDLLIVGNGTERISLENRITALGLQKKVFLVGEVANIQDYYKQCEIFVLPSRNEGYPNALIEAMSIGIPCIAMDCEFGPAEIINDGENGFLVKDGNLSVLSGLMDKLLTCDHLRFKIAAAAINILVSNSYQTIVNEWHSLIVTYA
ncbi:MAG: glycosyltransferase [Flavitalea sp.]